MVVSQEMVLSESNIGENILHASEVVDDSVQSSYWFVVCSKSRYFHKSDHMDIMSVKS